TSTRFPYTTLFRSTSARLRIEQSAARHPSYRFGTRRSGMVEAACLYHHGFGAHIQQPMSDPLRVAVGQPVGVSRNAQLVADAAVDDQLGALPGSVTAVPGLGDQWVV